MLVVKGLKTIERRIRQLNLEIVEWQRDTRGIMHVEMARSTARRVNCVVLLTTADYYRLKGDGVLKYHRETTALFHGDRYKRLNQYAEKGI